MCTAKVFCGIVFLFLEEYNKLYFFVVHCSFCKINEKNIYQNLLFILSLI